MLGSERLLAPVLTNPGLIRIDGKAQIGPVRVTAEDPLLVTSVVIEAHVRLVVVASHTGVGCKVVDVGEGLAR